VNSDTDLRKKLRDTATKKISAANAAQKYDFTSADLDNDVLAIEISMTDFQLIIEQITGDEVLPFAESYEELVKTWFYVIRLELPDKPPLYVVRKVPGGAWSAKKVKQLINMVFQNNMLVDLKQEEIFRIDGHVDFFAFDDALFIAEKNNFEAALNFRVGMENNRDEIVAEFKKLKLFADADEVGKLVGDNMRLLRRLSQVKNAGYYSNTEYMKKLKAVSAKEKWGLEYNANDELVVSEENIELVLRLLNNDRLTSKVNEENFDVDVKHSLGA
jgi:hypothetical protein